MPLRESEQAENSPVVSEISLHTVRKCFPFFFFFFFFFLRKSWPAVKCYCCFEITSGLRWILKCQCDENQGIYRFSTPLLITFPQIKSTNNLQEPLHQVSVRTKPSLNKQPYLPRRHYRAKPPSELLSRRLLPSCSDSAFPHIHIHDGFTYQVTSAIWSICWVQDFAQRRAKLQLAQCFPARLHDLFHQYLWIK